MRSFTKNFLGTIIARIVQLALAMITSIMLARILGPEGKGFYSVAMLLPSFIITFFNLGMSSATVYYTARESYKREEILGNNILLSGLIGGIGLLIGLVIVARFSEQFFPGIPHSCLMIALFLIPMQILFTNVSHMLLGVQRIKELNLISLFLTFSFLAILIFIFVAINTTTMSALVARLLAEVLVFMVLFVWVYRIIGGISFKLNLSYIKHAVAYGLQAHLGNVFWFLNHRVDMLLVNGYLGPISVGFYSVAVGLTEQLWIISQAASNLLFPRIAAERNEHKRSEITPFVARSVLLITITAGMIIFISCHWIIELFYSANFIEAVQPLRALLPGIIALSIGRVLTNDIAGRGFPILNSYVSGLSLITNIFLDIMWIPKFGIVGAAWASTVSYFFILCGRIFFYCRLSGNSWTKVIFPQKGDWALYRKLVFALLQWVSSRTKTLLN